MIHTRHDVKGALASAVKASLLTQSTRYVVRTVIGWDIRKTLTEMPLYDFYVVDGERKEYNA